MGKVDKYPQYFHVSVGNLTHTTVHRADYSKFDLLFPRSFMRILIDMPKIYRRRFNCLKRFHHCVGGPFCLSLNLLRSFSEVDFWD